MGSVIVFVTGAVIGMITILIASIFHFVGTLRVDRSEQDESYLFLELDKGVGDISSKKHVLLRVKLENFIPHK